MEEARPTANTTLVSAEIRDVIPGGCIELRVFPMNLVPGAVKVHQRYP